MFTKLKQIFKRSAKELTDLRSITAMAVLLAAAVVLDGFGSIRIGDFLKINFAFLPLAMIGILFGPVSGAAAGFLSDLIGYLANPIGGFIPELMLVTMLEGFLYGLILYRIGAEKNVRIMCRIVLARLLVCTVCNLTLNTWVLYRYGFLSAASFTAAFTARVATNIITFCIGSYMMMAVLLPLRHFYELHIRRASGRQVS